jgi:hypothetical protein
VSELYTGGELLDRILEQEYLTEKMAADYMFQIFQAMAY